MKEKPFQDIVPPAGKKSIKKVTLSHKRPRRSVSPVHSEPENQTTHEPPPPPPLKQTYRYRPPFSGSFLKTTAIVVGALLVFGFLLSLFFSGAKVSVTPKQKNVFLNATGEAVRGEDADLLVYEVMTFSREGSLTVPATGEERAEVRASGRIVVYNNFNSATQRLVKNTRFETPDGLIYRIPESIDVPGQHTVSGKAVPGSIEVTVYADEPGEKYNIDLTDFTIPGFQGSPRFEGFYARSKTPIGGGFIGTRLTVDDASREEARVTLQKQLQEQLFIDAFSQQPEGFQLYENGLFVVFESLQDVDQGEAVDVREKGILYGVLFDDKKLAYYAAQNTIAGFDNQPVRIQNPDDLAFTIVDKDSVKPWEEERISFALQGNAQLVWMYDREALKTDLAGRSKNALPTILSGYPGIEQVEVSLWPFWKSTFPEKTEDISIKDVLQ